MNLAWHNLNIKEVLDKLRSSVDGLEEKEARGRLKKYGPNSLPREKIFSRFYVFLSQFESPLVYILVLAGILSGVAGELADMVIILAAVAVNIIIGFVQEDKANKALAELKKVIEHQSRVIRGGREYIIKAEKLTVGDIVMVGEGARVPADGRLIFAKDLETDEAGLTGESLPITKNIKALAENVVLAERKNMVYMGTVVTRGRGIFVVTDIGAKTHFGEIASLVRETEEERTPLQARLSHLGRILGLLIVVFSVLLFLFGIVGGRSLIEMFLVSVAVAVGSIPEGLPIAITVILAIGMQRMSRQKALTRRLAAAETLGTVSVICADKTGTLTLGEMRAAHFINFSGDMFDESHNGHERTEALKMFAKISLLCSNAGIENPKDKLRDWIVFGNPTEKALLLKAYELGFDRQELEKEMPRKDEIAFSSDKKFMATLHKKNGGDIVLVKGAPEILFEKCAKILKHKEEWKFEYDEKSKMRARLEEMTGRGLRVLALAYKKAEKKNELSDGDIKDLVLVGLVGLKDPLRETSRDTVLMARKAGVRTVIVTGDHLLTAKAIAIELGLRTDKENIVEGRDLDKMTDEQLNKKIKDIDVFSRVMPKHKLRIVAAWREKGEVVAMTGDGINDAPAIKSADIGIALGSGSDVAKEASDVVLLDNNFKTIVGAIEMGRVIFDNIRKVIVYLLSDSSAEIVLVAGSLFLGLPLPVTAVQILWVNLIEDSLPAFALALDRGEGDVMKRSPRRRKTPLLNTQMKVMIFLASLATNAFLFSVFNYVWHKTGNLALARTMTFVGLASHTLIIIYAFRSLRRNIWQTAFWKNHFLNLSVLLGFALLAFAIYVPALQKVFKTVPLSYKAAGLLLAIGLINLFFVEAIKWIFVRKNKIYA